MTMPWKHNNYDHIQTTVYIMQHSKLKIGQKKQNQTPDQCHVLQDKHTIMLHMFLVELIYFYKTGDWS